jgi:uncharacterized protein DUF6328
VPGETDKERRDRELIELLNELRVALPGIQVLFAFLLILPFTDRFEKLADVDRDVYFAAFVATTAATVLLITPTVFHRIRFRDADKEWMLQLTNRLAIAGSVFLAVAISCTVFLITDLLFGGLTATLVTAVTAVVLAWFWYGLALTREVQD